MLEKVVNNFYKVFLSLIEVIIYGATSWGLIFVIANIITYLLEDYIGKENSKLIIDFISEISTLKIIVILLLPLMALDYYRRYQKLPILRNLKNSLWRNDIKTGEKFKLFATLKKDVTVAVDEYWKTKKFVLSIMHVITMRGKGFKFYLEIFEHKKTIIGDTVLGDNELVYKYVLAQALDALKNNT